MGAMEAEVMTEEGAMGVEGVIPKPAGVKKMEAKSGGIRTRRQGGGFRMLNG